MKKEELEYYFETYSKLANICIRVYDDESLNKLLHFYGINYIGNDLNQIPLNMTISSFNSDKNIAVFDEKQFLLGYIKDETRKNCILFGPVRLNEITDSDVMLLMGKYNLPQIMQSDITKFLLRTPVMTIENFLMMLSQMYLIINEEIICIDKIMQENADVLSQFENIDPYIETVDIEMPHVSGDYEEAIAYYIKNGMVEEIEKLKYEEHMGKVGTLAPNYLRSLKNALIILNSMCIRAAISGGLDRETACTLGERYAQRIENSKTINELATLSPTIRHDYCQRVHDLAMPKYDDVHIFKATKYIQKNIYGKITAAAVADAVGCTPEYLSTLFKKHLNTSIMQYINQLKVNEAKKLLRFTDKSLTEIANLLSYSSQSHFQRRFKEVRGITPTEYRMLYKKGK